MRDFRELKVWEKAHRLTLDVYRVTKAFPKEELFALTSQTRRAAASIPANIAEGCCRNSNADFARFLQIALGSASEVDYHLLLARDLNYLTAADHDLLSSNVVDVKRMLTRFIQALQAPSGSPKNDSLIADS